MRAPSVRGAYDMVERTAGRRIDAAIRAEGFARLTAVVFSSQRSARRSMAGLSARVWHLANLPAGTDVQRLRTELGELDREVRRLRIQLSVREADELSAREAEREREAQETGDGRP